MFARTILLTGVLALLSPAVCAAADPGIAPCLDRSAKAERLACYARICSPGEECARHLTTAATELRGPESGIELLHDILDEPAYGIQTTGHDIAHVVGRRTAKRFGGSGKYFLRCPRDFLYGCQHGFFEQVLVASGSPVEAARAICDHLPDPTPSMIFFCYHGVGHGLMMARGNDIHASLAECDRITGDIEQHGCAQGVFMENIVAYGEGESLPGVFNDDPLSPCDAAEPRHQWGCYVNHAPYLLSRFGGQWEDLIDACLQAPGEMIPICMFNAGQLTSDPLWQLRIRTTLPLDPGLPMPVRAARLCEAVSSPHDTSCVSGAIEYLIQYDKETDALTLCDTLEDSLRSACFTAVGRGLRDHLPRADDPCGIVPVKGRSACKEGLHAPIDFGDVPRPSVWNRAMTGLRKLATSLWHRIGRAVSLPFALRRGETQSSPAAVVIRYDGARFVPQEVTVTTGQTVTWINDGPDGIWPASDDHPTHLLYSAFDPRRPVRPGDRWSFTFARMGRWVYHNHLYASQTGAIVVEP